MRYLDPRADLTFKRIFGEHEDLVISLLNALLPLDEDHLVKEVKYIPIELVPDTPLKKNSIVDVRCKDMEGRAEGEAKGRAEGELEGKLAVARNLKSAGLELGDIAKYTGLSLEALARI